MAEAAIAEWAQRFDDLFSPEERAEIDAMTARDLAAHATARRTHARAAAATARPRPRPTR